jgi:hypothetical protein
VGDSPDSFRGTITTADDNGLLRRPRRPFDSDIPFLVQTSVSPSRAAHIGDASSHAPSLRTTTDHLEDATFGVFDIEEVK